VLCREVKDGARQRWRYDLSNLVCMYAGAGVCSKKWWGEWDDWWIDGLMDAKMEMNAR